MIEFAEVYVFTKPDFQRFLSAITGAKPSKEKLGRMLRYDDIASEFRTTAYMKEGSTVIHEQAPESSTPSES